jgi:CheY-like chemotaxis protein/two-component sensor histidine kinase
MIRRNIEMEARLIDDLLDVTSISKGKLKIHQEVVDVHATLKRVVEMLKEGLEAKRLELELRLNAEEPRVQADLARLHQVFSNLLRNAIKFTQIGGKITITTGNESQPSVGTPEKFPPPAAPQLIATIADTGIGIEPESLPRLFNAFEQGGPRIVREFGGLGLGLTICRSLVEAHGGWISAFSEGRGRGATFKVGLPTTVGEIPPQPKRPLPPQAAVTSRKLKILLVEDHPDTSWILSRLLTTNGHSVKIADSIRSALQCSSEEFDLLISDLGLPDGSGIELMQKLQEAGRPITGIALSGFGTEEDVRRSREAGFSEHLTKPVDFGSLLATIHQVRESAELRGF